MQVALAKQEVHCLVDTLPASLLQEAANFIKFIKIREERKLYKDLEALSVSSTNFWDNEIDDEVWNNA
ncbi:MAG: DUF2281 domain-containing protein [Defluviitaleaceae bacterium]|nr:DUF2281 domain-containing protein [Defluviitaleaceae bacterium]